MSLVRVVHGSTSPSKMDAVDTILNLYFPFPLELIHTPISSGVDEQPRSLAETVKGAKIRAVDALLAYKGKFGIGIESGIVELPGSRSGAMELTVCAIFNGKNYALGQSAGFEVPVTVMGDIIANKHTLTGGFENIGFISKEHAHGESGILAKLAQGRMDRRAQNEQAILMALIQLDNPDLYGYNE